MGGWFSVVSGTNRVWDVSLGGYKTVKKRQNDALKIRYPYCRLALSRVYSVVDVFTLLHVFMRDMESAVCVSGNTRDAVLLTYFYCLLIFTLITYALIVEILYWFHKSSSCKQ